VLNTEPQYSSMSSLRKFKVEGCWLRER